MWNHKPERRRESDRALDALAQVLDELDYGLLLLNPQLELAHINRAAEAELGQPHSLCLHGRHLVASDPRDARLWREALQDAAHKGLRRMVSLGCGVRKVRLSVLPLRSKHSDLTAVLVVLARREMVSALTAQAFARTHQLSSCEEQVLLALCQGMSPQEIADQHGVKIATVRTQVSSVRAKTGAASIRDLVHLVACLPPMVSSLRLQLSSSEHPRLAA